MMQTNDEKVLQTVGVQKEGNTTFTALVHNTLWG